LAAGSLNATSITRVPLPEPITTKLMVIQSGLRLKTTTQRA
ncbi:uncharacterized protein METZ01_LOCUS496192, partial [marine metagenome]